VGDKFLTKKLFLLFILLLISSILNITLAANYNNIAVLELINKSPDYNSKSDVEKNEIAEYTRAYNETINISSEKISKNIYDYISSKLEDKKIEYFPIKSYKNYDLNNKNDITKFAKVNNLDLMIWGNVLSAYYHKAKVVKEDKIVYSTNTYIKLKISFIDKKGNILFTFYPEKSLNTSKVIKEDQIIYNNPDLYDSLIEETLNSISKQIYNKLNEYL
jgi:hypothetical protein